MSGLSVHPPGVQTAIWAGWCSETTKAKDDFPHSSCLAGSLGKGSGIGRCEQSEEEAAPLCSGSSSYWEVGREQEEAGGDAEGRAQPTSGKSGMKGLEKHKIDDCEAGWGEGTCWDERLVREGTVGEVRSGISWE